MRKKCFRCGRELPLSEFYKHPRMGDGHLGKCKDCCKSESTANRNEKREYYAAYERRRVQDPGRKSKMLDYQRERRGKNPEKYKARGAVSNAIRDGRLHREPCVVCGCENSQAHHEDYAKPLDVIWVCFACHREKYHGQTVTTGATQ